MSQPLARIIEQLKREPSRTGSIVITVFGDAIVPRGGSVWLGTLLEFFETARHRRRRGAYRDVAADRRGWFERHKVGRNSFIGWCRAGGRPRYRHQTYLWCAGLRLDRAVRTAADRQWRRSRRLARGAEEAGFGSPLPGVWVAPSGVPVPEEAAGAIRLEVSAEDESGRRLLSESWPLERTADAYQKFMKTFEPLHSWIERGEQLADADAFTARILLIHHYRRVVLRDPLLPQCCCQRTGRAGRHEGSVARSIARCFRHPSNGLTATPATKTGPCQGGGGTGTASRPDAQCVTKNIFTKCLL